MSEDTEVEVRCRKLAQKLRAMFKGSDPAKSRDRRPIVHLFGVAYADDLEGLEDAELMFLAVQAGLPARTFWRLIQDGRELAQYVGVCRNSVRAGTNTQKTVVIAVLEQENGR